MSYPDKFCFVCGKLCYGYTCKECKGNKKYSSLARLGYDRKKRPALSNAVKTNIATKI